MSTKPRTDSLTTADMYNLDDACILVAAAFGCPYLVGTATTGGPYRDVDVRLILGDEEFDALFKDKPYERWELLTLAIGDYLRRKTSLPIDFQIQRQTEANEKHTGEKGTTRNPLGMTRRFAAGGDGTPSWLLELPRRR